ncbi:MAG: anthranilate synthase component I [Thermodesulfobacteriota bacterium]
MRNSVYSPTLDEFREIAKTHNLIPVGRDILADTETPVSAFMKIDNGGEAFLLESVEHGEKWGRYSFIGASARAVIKGFSGVLEITEDGNTTTKKGDPIELLASYMSSWKAAPAPEDMIFSGGAVGFFSYDAVRYIEKIPDIIKKDTGIPDLCFMITDTFLVFDNAEQKIKAVCNARTTDNGSIEAAYRLAVEKIDALVKRLRQGRVNAVNPPSEDLPVASNFPKEKFKAAVERVKEYIAAGDVIQTVISQRFETKLNCEPFDIYRALRVTNPSPYMFFLRLGGVELAGSSPEILVRVEGKDITIRPIAGTRKRGRDEAEDNALERELLSDPKERAEHIMLVDLGRNDVGRVAVPGSVKVTELMVTERYSHVMHIVSNVRAIKKDGVDAFGVFRACFPAGTLTGAPKIRAMEIIEEVEPMRRGVYGGCVGYVGFSGNMDMCITIRTVIVKDGMAYVQSGAGIVADSVPEKEFEETVNKARGVLKAVTMARKGFD